MNVPFVICYIQLKTKKELKLQDNTLNLAFSLFVVLTFVQENFDCLLFNPKSTRNGLVIKHCLSFSKRKLICEIPLKKLF
jgi:hypothetical protein